MERTPHNNNDEIIRLAIKPGNRVSKRVTLSALSEENRLPNITAPEPLLKIRPESFDSGSIEGLGDLMDFLNEKKDILDEWQKTPKEKNVSANTFETVENIRGKIADIKIAIGYQTEALVQLEKYTDSNGDIVVEGESEESIEEISQLIDQVENRGFHIKSLLEEVLGEFDNFLDVKEGWWDKELQAEAGVVSQGADAELKQVWGDQDGPIGFEPGVIERDNNKERKGWWDKDFRNERGVSENVPDGDFVQRGEITPRTELEADGREMLDSPVERTRRRLVVEPRVPSGKTVSIEIDQGSVDGTSRRVFRGGSYPENQDPRELKKSELITSGGLLEHYENETQILEEYRSKVEQLKKSVTEIPKFNEENETAADRGKFDLLQEDLEALESVLNRAEYEHTEVGEISSVTKDYFDSYHSKILTGIAYYESLIADNDRLFEREGVIDPEIAGLAGMQTNANSPAPETIGSLKSSTYLSRQPKVISFEDYTVPPEYLAYGETREKWLEAKKVHDEKNAEYLSAVDQHYADWAKEVEGRGFLDRNWTKFRTKFGLKPELPEEITALRGEADAASETYGQYAREMTEKRGLAGKKTRSEISPEVLDRYNRRFGHEIVVNTLKRQTESQAKAVESLGFKSNKFVSYLSKNKTMIKLLGAGALGAATGGLAGVVAGGAWWARSTAGGAAAAGVAGLTNKKWSESIKNWTEAQQEAEVRNLAAKINDKALSKEEIAEHRGKLEAILAQADEKNRTKMFAIIGLAAVTGAVVGGGVGAAGEEFFGTGGSAAGASGAEDASAGPATTESPAPGAANTETVPGDSEGASASEGVASPEASSAYVAERGDNLWDIMEGQTNAGQLDYLDNVAEGDRQRLIALVTERVNQDATLRAELGFGATADNLLVGAEVDVERLNELAEEIAREKNLYTETPAVPAEGSPNSAGGEAVAAAAPDTDTPPTPDRSGGTTEALTMSSVSPDRIIEYARQYEGGYTKFQTDFEKQFVERIQGPAPADSLLGRLFGGAPNSADAFKVFGAYPVGEFNQLATRNPAELAQALAEEQIDMRDYLAWRDELAKWQEAGLVINPNARFSDVAEAAFINSLSQPRGT